MNWDDPQFHSVGRRFAACCIRVFEIWDDGFLGYVSLSGFVHRKFRRYIGHLVQDYKHKTRVAHAAWLRVDLNSSFSRCCGQRLSSAVEALMDDHRSHHPLSFTTSLEPGQTLSTGSSLPQTSPQTYSLSSWRIHQPQASFISFHKSERLGCTYYNPRADQRTWSGRKEEELGGFCWVLLGPF